jgi:tyrosyl-tRNA synthetase
MQAQKNILEQMRVAWTSTTADSLHMDVGVMLLKHFQIAGHKPLAL